MKDSIISLLQKVPMPGEKISIVEAQIIHEILEHNNELTIQLHLPQKYEKFQQALAPTIQDVIKRELGYTGTILVPITIIKANKSKEPGGISKVKQVIAVASGKGGVGKSTVSVNLALSLAKLGYSVGLLDADIFGPSIPKMLHAEGETPSMKKIENKEFIIPLEKHGITFLSIGFFIKDSDALAWRGPMAGNVLKQLIVDTDWGELDIMVIDMPPGTSDIQLTICQTIELSGAVMVSTPQDVAVIDVVRGIDFFQKEHIEVPILGIVENMAWFTPAELPDNKYYIFGKGGVQTLAQETNIPFLGHIPIVQSIREGGDAGNPIVLQNSLAGTYFIDIAEKIAQNIQD